MSDQRASWGDRLASIARVILLCAIALVATLIIIGPKNTGLPNPLSVMRVQADGSICAAPGYLMLITKQGGAAKFYLCDTNKQVICMYETVGEKFRLVAARKFDHDADIFDASLNLPNTKSPESNANGITRKEADDYAAALKLAKEKFEGKKKP
ncbi:MAG: hypothetical protein NTW87_15075 [Planctomycetota bacterium]|nr:hypothetical protein [Planctomycetota bacterium]